MSTEPTGQKGNLTLLQLRPVLHEAATRLRESTTSEDIADVLPLLELLHDKLELRAENRPAVHFLALENTIRNKPLFDVLAKGHPDRVAGKMVFGVSVFDPLGIQSGWESFHFAAKFENGDFVMLMTPDQHRVLAVALERLARLPNLGVLSALGETPHNRQKETDANAKAVTVDQALDGFTTRWPLGMLADERARKVRRDGCNKVVNLSNRAALWIILKALAEAREPLTAKALLFNDAAGDEAVYANVTLLRKALAPLGVGVSERRYKLQDLTAEPEIT